MSVGSHTFGSARGVYQCLARSVTRSQLHSPSRLYGLARRRSDELVEAVAEADGAADASGLPYGPPLPGGGGGGGGGGGRSMDDDRGPSGGGGYDDVDYGGGGDDDDIPF